jgi:hypothetical protein
MFNDLVPFIIIDIFHNLLLLLTAFMYGTRPKLLQYWILPSVRATKGYCALIAHI